jgi:uncharacterized protein involved in tolerance to divalent cations
VEAAERQYFELLKTKIVAVMQTSNAGISNHIGDWKGQDIIEFQEDMRLKVNEYISEKWFYNHFKTHSDKLPRIDVLNILSRYTGYIDWAEFKHKNKDRILIVNDARGSNRIFYLMPLTAVILFLLVWAVIKTGSVATYQFCFVDKDSREPVKTAPVEVTLLYEDESPVQVACTPEACFSIKTGAQRIKFLVKAPYYHPDTITRILKKTEKNEVIQLRMNDYALMIHYYANANIDDWEKRKETLNRIIADSAYICQVFNREMMGMELYNKQEFIDMLTTPARSLQQIHIIDMLYCGEKITTIRFTRDVTKE